MGAGVKRARGDGVESETGSEEFFETSSERGEAREEARGGRGDTEVSAEFSMSNIQTDIPGLEDILSTESKSSVMKNNNFY